MQSVHPDARSCWVAGFSFGAWIGMQLLMRRPEIEGFISVAPPANLHDFTFLAPCPSSGLIIHGDQDKVVPPKDVQTLVDKLKTQKGIKIEQTIVHGANHFFENNIDELIGLCSDYVDRRLARARRRRLSHQRVPSQEHPAAVHRDRLAGHEGVADDHHDRLRDLLRASRCARPGCVPRSPPRSAAAPSRFRSGPARPH